MTAIALITAVALAAGSPAANVDPKIADSKTIEAVKATCFDLHRRAGWRATRIALPVRCILTLPSAR